MADRQVWVGGLLLMVPRAFLKRVEETLQRRRPAIYTSRSLAREELRRSGLPMPKMCGCLQVLLEQARASSSDPALGPRPRRCTGSVLEFKKHF